MNQQPKPTIRIFHNLARSGGTLIGKCLGCMEEIALLSEIHPDSQRALSFNAVRQAQQWLDFDPTVEWKKTAFIEAIHQINEHCQKLNKTLILRDWSHVDYFGFPVTNTPQHSSSLIHCLEPHFDILSIQLIRHPIDTWESMKKLNLVKRANLSIHDFMLGYSSYIKQTGSECQLFYEIFLQQPDAELKRICQALKCTYDPNFKNKWHSYSNITGDQSSQSSLRKSLKIEPRKPKKIDLQTLQGFAENPEYSRLLKNFPHFDVIKC